MNISVEEGPVWVRQATLEVTGENVAVIALHTANMFPKLAMQGSDHFYLEAPPHKGFTKVTIPGRWRTMVVAPGKHLVHVTLFNPSPIIIHQS